MKKIIIAIDGYSSCGKSTFAKAIASQLGYIFIDTGAMYRAVTLYAIKNKIISENIIDTARLESCLEDINIGFEYDTHSKKNQISLNGKNVENEIRSIDISDNVSLLSQNRAVREKLVAIQQKIGENGGVVMDGRDIGTVVFPNADLKIFMTASVDIRAQRRYKEMIEKGENITIEQIKQNISQRDYQDENREISPLKRAFDAIILDNSNMSVNQQMGWVMEKIEKITNN